MSWDYEWDFNWDGFEEQTEGLIEGYLTFTFFNMLTIGGPITSTSTELGKPSDVGLYNIGGGNVQVTGGYTGFNRTQIEVRIVDTTVGKKVGEAKFIYTLDGLTWETNNDQYFLTTSTPFDLSTTGLKIAFINSTTTQPSFEVGDSFLFWVSRRKTPENLILPDSQTTWRSKESETMIRLEKNLGLEQSFNCVIFNRHNLDGTQELRFEATSNELSPGEPDWSSDKLSVVIDYDVYGKAILLFPTEMQTFQYVSLLISNVGGKKISASHWHVGVAFQFSNNLNTDYDDSLEVERADSRNKKSTITRVAEGLVCDVDHMNEDDKKLYRFMFRYLNPVNGNLQPLYYMLDSFDDYTQGYLDQDRTKERNKRVDRSTVQLKLKETE